MTRPVLISALTRLPRSLGFNWILQRSWLESKGLILAGLQLDSWNLERTKQRKEDYNETPEQDGRVPGC